MPSAPSTPTRRAAILVLVTLVAVVIELVQRESALKILVSAWLPALVLVVYWTRANRRSALR
ncbi:MAG TPA: hypothetical protein VFR49_01330 [Solirubrobacteraceae bacterium]|nr:hypothetical protein [Solirubrobacteraceae bacterium]